MLGRIKCILAYSAIATVLVHKPNIQTASDTKEKK